MLRTAKITLSNAARPNVAPIRVTAVVTDEDLGIVIGATLVEKLELVQVDQRDTLELGSGGPRRLPYVGPLRVTLPGGRDVFTGAIQAGAGVVLGRSLARELGLEQAIPETAGETSRILVHEHAVEESLCRELCAHVAANREAALPSRVGIGGPRESHLDEHVRSSHAVPIAGVEERLNDLLFCLFTTHVEPFFGVDVEWWEKPQILLYREGGKYEVHADADRWAAAPGGGGRWERHTDRDVSVLVYLNDDFTGGKLDFPELRFKIAPKRGMLVAFPSSGLYRHGAERTETGERLVVVSWAGTNGGVRVEERPRSPVFKRAWLTRES